MLAITLIEVAILVALSAVCSGLNVAFMSLEIRDLSRRKKLGNKNAALVLPLRRKTHLVLAAILLTNVAVISATSVVLDNRYNGVIAEVASTLLIVIFGEVFPQALFMTRALAFTARLSKFLWLMVIVTYPISKPLQILLDRLIGKPVRRTQSRHELGLMISEHLTDKKSELDDDEIEIMRGALTLSEKHVRDIMTPIKKVYWLDYAVIIDDKKIDEIKREGWSRIPIFSSDLRQFYGVLLIKDLVDMDFDEHTYSVKELQLYRSQPVGSMTALDTMFRRFIAAKSHLIPVEKDDKIIGIVTIEDLLEEIVGHEITDETDHQHNRQ